jgi:hypothetical protein
VKKVRDNTSVPGIPWKYVCPEDGFALTDIYFNRLKSTVAAYRHANSYPVGLLFNEEYEENLCAQADPKLCLEFVPPSLLEKMSTLGRALVNAALNARHPVVSAEEVERRRQICGECNFFGGSKSVLKVACKVCGCGGLKLFLTTSACPLSQPKW